jgi:hypothetical protein
VFGDIATGYIVMLVDNVARVKMTEVLSRLARARPRQAASLAAGICPNE